MVRDQEVGGSNPLDLFFHISNIRRLEILLSKRRFAFVPSFVPAMLRGVRISYRNARSSGVSNCIRRKAILERTEPYFGSRSLDAGTSA
jgi:hypothetical protein